MSCDDGNVTRVACCLLLLLLNSVGCERRNALVTPPPPEVTVAQPIIEPVTETIDFTGTTEARETVEIRARITGYLQRVDFEDGANVQAGDLLMVIEPAPFAADVEAAEAALQKAVAVEGLAQANLARALELQKGRAIAKQEVDADSAELATATANVRAARAALRKAQLDLGYTEIQAPISGRIGRRLIDVGNLVNAEQTHLAIIENIDPIYAYFNVSESVLLRFMALVREKKLPDPAVSPPVLRMELQNEKGFPHQGYLDYTDLGVDPTTGTIRRRAVFPNADRLLVPGLFVRLRSEIGDPTPKLLVEERALGSDQRGAFVLVINDSDVVEYRPVKLGLRVNSLRVIEEGIQKGDWIVVNGLQRARPGSKVQAQRARMSDTSESAGASSLPEAEEPTKAKAQPKGVPAESRDSEGLRGAATSPHPSRHPRLLRPRSISRQCLHASSSNARYLPTSSRLSRC